MSRLMTGDWDSSVLNYRQAVAHIELAIGYIKGQHAPWVTADVVLTALHHVAARLRLDAAAQDERKRPQ
jgi:hypothetical protein